MADFLPPAVLKLKVDLSEWTTKLAEATAELRAFADETKNIVKKVDLTESVNRGITSGALRREGERAGQEVGTGFLVGFRKFANTAPNISWTGVLGGIGRGIAVATLPSLIGAGVGAAAQLLPLVSNLLGLVGFLPAAIGGLILSLTTLKLAFHGVGTALQAGLTGNLTAYATAMKKLVPAQQEFVKQIVALKPMLDSLKQSVATGFFSGLADTVKALGHQYLPLLNEHLGEFARTLGGIVKQIGAVFSTKASYRAVAESLANITLGLQNATHAVGGFVSGMLTLFAAGARFLPELGLAVGNLGARFGAFMDAVNKSGALDQWLQNGIDATKQLWTLLKGAASIIGSIIHAVSALGGSPLGVLGVVIAQLAQLFKSSQGQQGLQALFAVLGAFASTVGQLLVVVLQAVLDVFVKLGPVVIPLIDQFANKLVPVISKLADTLGVALVPLLIALTPALVDILTAMLPIVDAFSRIITFITPFLDFLSRSPGLVTTLIGALVAWKVAAYAAAIAQGVLDLALDANPIGLFVIAIAAMVVEIAGMIYVIVQLIKHWDEVKVRAKAIWDAIWGGINSAGKDIGGWFTGIWHNITSTWDNAITNIKNLVAEIPYYLGYIAGLATKNFVDELGKLPGQAGDLIVKVWNGMIRLTETGYHNFLAWWDGLPGAIGKALTNMWNTTFKFFKDAGIWLYDTGKDIITGLIKGLVDGTIGLFKAIGSITSQVIKGFRVGVGAHSPSTVFASIGKDIVDGLVIGLGGGPSFGVGAYSPSSSAGPTYMSGNVYLDGQKVGKTLIQPTQRYKFRQGYTGLS